MAMSKAKIERTLRENGLFLAKTTGMEKASQGSSEGMNWRIGKLHADGIHGWAGGQYFRNLEEVSDYVSMNF